MNNILLLLVMIFLGACSKNADLGKLPGVKDPTNIRPTDPVSETLNPELEWSMPLVSFPMTTVNNEREQVVTLRNKGQTNSQPIQLMFADNSTTNFMIKSGTNNCAGEILSPNETCSFTVLYKPLTNGGKTNVLMATDLIVSKSLMLTGLADGGASSVASPAKLIWILDDYDFGATPVGGNKHYDFIVANIGGELSDVVTSSWVVGTSPFSMVAGFNFCENQTLAPGANCKVRVRLSPTVAGNFVNVLKITDGISTDDIQISGNGVIIPSQLVLNPTSYSFNQVLVGSQKNLDVTLRNDASVNSGTINLSWADTNHYSLVAGFDTCSGQILPGGSTCTFKVRFTPSVVGNDLNNILTADDGFSSATLTVNGSGQDPASNFPVAIDKSLNLAEDILVTDNLQGMDPNGLALTYVLVGNATKGNVILLNASSGAFRYTPDLNQTGVDSFTFRVRNSNNDLSAVATVSLNIIGINDPPIAVNDNISTNEDTALNIPVLGNDSDVEGNVLSVVSVTSPSKGVAVINADNTIRYTPNLNATGSDSFSYNISDGAGGSASAIVYVTINAINDTPVANNASFSLNEDSSLNANIQGSDPENSPLIYSLVSLPTKGTVVLTNANTGAFTYTPNPDANGTDSFTFKVNDGTGDSNIATASININSVNDLPVAQNMVLNVVEDTPKDLVLDVSDKENDSLIYTIVTSPSHGVLSGTAPNLTYTPNSNYSGMDAFSYKVDDGQGQSSIANVSVMVWTVNDAPVAQDSSFTVIEDSGANNKLLVATDVDGNSLTYTLVTTPTKGTVTITNSATGAYIYTPNANAFGSDSFTFKVNDGVEESNIATVEIEITPVYDLPVANNMNIQTLKDVNKNGTLSFTYIENNTPSVSIVSGASNGTVTILNPVTGDYLYAPNPNYSGVDSFTFVVTTTSGSSNTATVTIEVDDTNDVPVANNISFTTNEDTNYSGSLSALDNDGDTLTYSIVMAPTKGLVVITNANTGAFTYIPNANENGSDSFTYKVNDGSENSNIATATVTITPVNDAPIANSKILTTTEETPVAVNLVASDVENSSLTYIIVTNPSNGVLSGTGPNFTYTPNPNFPNNNSSGNDSFTYKVNDGNLDSQVVAVSITVNSSNDLPVANNSSFSTNEDTVYNGSVTSSDPDNDVLSYSLVSSGTKGVVVLNPTTGAFNYTPNLNANGTDSFTFRTNDGTGNSNTATVSVTIIPVNDAPVANNSSVTAQEDTLYSGNVSATDIEGSSLTYTVVGNVSNGTLTLNPTTGAFTYKGNQDYTGSDSFTYKVNDGNLDSAVATVSISVEAFNNIPVANNLSFSTNEDTVYSGTVTASDPEGDTLSYSVVVNGGKGVVVMNSSTGAFTYTPNLNSTGTDMFTFKVNDGTANSSTASVSVNINPVNDAPVALNDNYSTNRNTPVNIVLSGTDVENSVLTYSIVSPPLKGVLSGTIPNLVYTPNAGQTGADSFTFKVNDGSLDSSSATVSLNIVNTNELPVAQSGTLAVNEDTATNGTLVATDANSDPLNYSVVAQGTKGTVLITNALTGAYTYTPNLNATGIDSFSFKVHDGYGNSNTATIAVTINPINDAPVANGQSITTKENTSKGLSLSGTDPDGDSLTYAIAVAPTKGVLSGTAPNLTYTPNKNQVGTDSFTFTVNDGNQVSAPATVNISITDMGGWFNTTWLYRRKLHIDNQNLGALTDVPVMVRLDSSRIDYSKTKSGGVDVRFTDNQGNLLKHEIERWNSSGVSTLWVKVPQINANSTNGFIWMYYGNSSAMDAQAKPDVWSNGYVAVYHLEETTGLPQDSTGVNHASEVAGAVTRNISGKMAGAEGFNSNSDVIKINNSSSLNITANVTLEAWVYQNSTGTDRRIVEKEDGGDADYGLWMDNGRPKIRIESKQLEFSSSIPLNTWTYIAGTFNTTTNQCQLYSSQGELYKTSTGCTDNIVSTNNKITIGNDDDFNRYFPGVIDEVRISNVERSSDWIQLQGKSMTDGLLVFGSEQNHSNPLTKSALSVIASNNDDGEITETGTKTNMPYMGEQSDTNNWGFFRFKYPVSIPSSATIVNTRLNLFGVGMGGWNSSSHYLSVRAEKTANAPQLTGNNQCPGCSSNKAITTANTSWGSPGFTWNIGAWNTSSNFSSVTQELVNTYSGLSANNYMQVWVTRGYNFSGTATAEVGAMDYNDMGNSSAQLLIEWTE